MTTEQSRNVWDKVGKKFRNVFRVRSAKKIDRPIDALSARLPTEAETAEARRRFIKGGAFAAGGAIAGLTLGQMLKKANAQPTSTPASQLNEWSPIQDADMVIWQDSSGNVYVKDCGVGNQPGALVVNANVITAYGQTLSAGTSGASTSTGGIMEAYNTGASAIVVKKGSSNYSISANITPPANTHLHFQAGVGLTWSGGAILKITAVGGISITSGIVGAIDTADYAPNISSLTIDDTSNNVLDLEFKGLTFGASTNTTQACVTFNQPGSFEIDQVHFVACGFQGSVVVTNPTAAGQGSPTEIDFTRCVFAGANQTSATIHADMLGQWYFTTCTFVSYKNGHVLFQLDGNNTGIAQVSNSIQLGGCCQWVANASLTGLEMVNIQNNATMAIFTVDGMYIEDNSPVTLLTVGASGAAAEGKLMHSYRDVLGFTSGGITLANISSSADVTNQSMILFDHVGSAYAAAAIGTIPGFDYPNIRIKNCFGLVEIGTTPLLCPPTLQKTETGADSSVLSFTPLTTAGTYKIRIVISCSAASAATLGWTATWKDSNSRAQAPTNLSLFTSGTAAPALTVTAAANAAYYGEAQIDIDTSGTAITIKTTFSGTSIAYKASAWIERVQ